MRIAHIVHYKLQIISYQARNDSQLLVCAERKGNIIHRLCGTKSEVKKLGSNLSMS